MHRVELENNFHFWHYFEARESNYAAFEVMLIRASLWRGANGNLSSGFTPRLFCVHRQSNWFVLLILFLSKCCDLRARGLYLKHRIIFTKKYKFWKCYGDEYDLTGKLLIRMLIFAINILKRITLGALFKLCNLQQQLRGASLTH